MSYNKNVSTDMSMDDPIDEGWLKSIAHYISAIFSPPLVLLYGVFLCAYAVQLPSIFLWTLVFLSLFILIPLGYTLYMMKTGIIGNFHMESRKERIKPLTIVFIHSILSLFLFKYIGGPDIFLLIAISSIVALGMVVLISLFWKISGHATSAGGLLAIGLYYYDHLIYVICILAALIIWSRIKLGCHTIAQTAVGFGMGVLTFGSFFVFFA